MPGLETGVRVGNSLKVSKCRAWGKDLNGEPLQPASTAQWIPLEKGDNMELTFARLLRYGRVLKWLNMSPEKR